MNQSHDDPSALPPEVQAYIGTLDQWLRTPHWAASRTFLEAHPELLTSQAAQALAALTALAQAHGTSRDAAMMALHGKLLADAAQSGIASAYDGLELMELLRKLEAPAQTADELTAREASLERAIALVSRDKLPELWASLHGNLGIALAAASGDPARQHRAVVCFRMALTVYRRDTHPDEWAQTQYNLSVALTDLSNLVTGQVQLDVRLEAAEADRAARTVHPGLTRRTQLQRHTQWAGLTLFGQGDWARAAHYLSIAHDDFEANYSGYRSARDREWEMGETLGLSAALAYALLRTGEPRDTLRAAYALESSRARSVSTSIRRYRILAAAAGQLPAALHERLREATLRLEEASLGDAAPNTAAWVRSLPPEERERRGETVLDDVYAQFQHGMQVQQDYDEVMREIRQAVPDFGAETDVSAEAAVMAATRTLDQAEGLVYLAHCDAGGAAVLLLRRPSGDGPETSALGWWDRRFTTPIVSGLLERHDRQGRPAGGLLPAQMGAGDLGWAVSKIVALLGINDGVLAKLARACQEQAIQRLTIIPCGLMSLLPLHAAMVPRPRGRRSQPLLDVVQVGYAPSAWIWTQCRDRASRTERRPVNALVVGNPLPVPPGVPPLEGAAEEARVVAAIGGRAPGGQVTHLEATRATRDAVLGALRRLGPTLTHVHFACHAQAVLSEPQQSGLLLADGARLTTRDLLEPGSIRLGGLRLAVLSACQTGLVGTFLPDEMTGLPASWLEAGVSGVVASLWPVSDEATVALMTMFYDLHLRDGIEPGEALWLAQRWLRGLPGWAEDFSRAGAAPRPARATQIRPAPGDDQRGMRSALRRARSALLRQAEWSDPVHWAAFAMYGC